MDFEEYSQELQELHISLPSAHLLPPKHKPPGNLKKNKCVYLAGWFQIFFIFTLTWGRFPI